jgi:hypothetical protein
MATTKKNSGTFPGQSKPNPINHLNAIKVVQRRGLEEETKTRIKSREHYAS